MRARCREYLIESKRAPIAQIFAALQQGIVNKENGIQK
jgi:hypothetical protein